jgi:NitT/TauT family transport system substrate-binding protein
MIGFRALRAAVALQLVLAAWLDSSAQAQEVTANVRVATMPVTNFTPLLVARDKGWFAEEKINVTWTLVPQGAIAIEAVYGGSAEFGGGAILEPMIARGNGLDISFVATTSKINNKPPDNSGLLVRADDNIHSAKELVGKTISAGLVNSINYIHMHEWLQKKGVDPRSVKFLEIPFPQMADALFQNRIDAVWNVEPFVTFMLRTGKARVIAYPYQDNIPGMDITAFVAKDSWLKANSDVARRFKRALDRATVFLQQASKEERDEFVAKFSGVKPDVVSAMNLPQFSAEFNIPSLAQNLEIAVRHKVVKPFDVNTMMGQP